MALPAPYKYVIVEKDPETTQNSKNVPTFVAFDSLEDPIPVKTRRALLERMTTNDLKATKRVIKAINEEEPIFYKELGTNIFRGRRMHGRRLLI
ncbi:hypothetical protein EYR41_006865 [Orbilia oligospora]|uniref:Uncharacterized protein n=1 Tax=Orbilia oligospora TaxID=2813651 RepID=A0A8H2HIB1_ORBOL|nr:hypothetical protein EYR41_006865 [Orbilia oligospora]